MLLDTGVLDDDDFIGFEDVALLDFCLVVIANDAVGVLDTVGWLRRAVGCLWLSACNHIILWRLNKWLGWLY